jgi:hypothetical protein
MPNTYLKAEERVQLVLAALYKLSNLSNLITRFNGDNFIGALNDTLVYETPGITKARDYEFRTRTAGVIFDEIYKTKLPISINQHMTVGNKWTDEEEKFDRKSFAREVAVPMAQAMVDRFDAKILAALLAESSSWAVTDLNFTGTEVDAADNGALAVGIRLQGKLDAVGMPKKNRNLVLGANPYAKLAAAAGVTKYDPAQALTVFREGVFGNLAGFDLVNGTNIVGDNDVIAVHPSWAVLANCAPENPQGAVWSAAQEFQGYAARMLLSYDINYASDRALLNTFWGISPIRDQFARHTQSSATAANDGSEKGDIIIEDGKPKTTGKNVRGGSGTYSA